MHYFPILHGRCTVKRDILVLWMQNSDVINVVAWIIEISYYLQKVLQNLYCHVSMDHMYRQRNIWQHMHLMVQAGPDLGIWGP